MAPSRRIMCIVGLLALTIIQVGTATKIVSVVQAERLQPQPQQLPIQQQQQQQEHQIPIQQEIQSNREVYSTKQQQQQQQPLRTVPEEQQPDNFGWPSTGGDHNRDVAAGTKTVQYDQYSRNVQLPQRHLSQFTLLCPEATSLLTKIKATLATLIAKSPLKKLTATKQKPKLIVPSKAEKFAAFTSFKALKTAPIIIEKPIRQIAQPIVAPIEVFDPITKFSKFNKIFKTSYYQQPLQMHHLQQQAFRDQQQQQHNEFIQQQQELYNKPIEQQQEQNTYKQVEQQQEQSSYKQSEQQQQQEELLEEDLKVVGSKGRQSEQIRE